MKTRSLHILIFTAFIFVLSFSVMAEEPGRIPVLVSPGIEGDIASINNSCPTFSWTAVPGAAGYKIVVFNNRPETLYSYDELADYEKPVLTRTIKGQALSWTPSLREGLSPGESYLWFVLATDELGTELPSMGRNFRIEVPSLIPPVEKDLGTRMREKNSVEEYMKSKPGGMNSDPKRSNDIRRENDFLDSITGTEGTNNTMYGTNAGNGTMTGEYNSFFGALSGYVNTAGEGNTFSGYGSGNSNTTGSFNVFNGSNAGFKTTSGTYNTYLGYAAGQKNTTGGENTFVGDFAGFNNLAGSGNVFLGNEAGINETGSGKLYIDNTGTSTPLIQGDFSTDILTINGQLGVGTTAPSSKIELQTTGELAVFVVNRTDGASFKLAAGVANTQIGTQSNHGIKFTTNNTWKMRLNASGTLDMSDGGSYNGTWNNASSIDFKENIREISSDEAKYALEELTPVLYNYKKYKDEERAGFIAEHVPEIVANNDRKNLSAMDIVAVLTKVVKEQQKTIGEIKKENLQLKTELLKRLENLEKKKSDNE